MRRGVARVTQALAVALLAGVATAHAQIPITIDDVRVPEQSGGFWPLQVYVRLPGPAPQIITVQWSIVPGSATQTPGNDYRATLYNGIITFNPGEDSKPVDLEINGDTVSEWSPTLQQDEVFFVDLGNPSANARIDKGRSTITLLDDDRSLPGLQFLAAASTGDATSGQNTLQWRVPAAPVQPTDILIRWNTGVSCVSPASTVAGLTGPGSGEGFFVASFGYAMGAAGAAQGWPHTGLLPPYVPYCYSLFAYYAATPSAERATVKATPFDANAAPLKWSYSPGCNPPCAAATVVPPTVGFDAIYTVDNAGVVHAMQRGVAGGPWPGTWNPLALGKPAQSRSPVVPMKVAPALGDWRLFVGTDGGGVHAVDGKDGRLIWSRSAAFGTALPSLGGAQAAAAGLFRNFGGNNDVLLVGTNNSSSQFFALDLQTGGTLASYTNAALWNVTGMAVVDYAANRVYFTTWSPSGTVFALDLGAAGSPSLTLSALPGGNPRSISPGSYTGAVVRNNRLYLGETNNGQIDALDLSSGNSYNKSVGDGQVKGFLWPDRRNNNLYFSADTQVHAVRDTGTSLEEDVWGAPLTLTSPSMVLQKPGTDYLYVGDGNGRLVQIDASSGTQIGAPLLLDPGFQIGAPSLDNVWNLVVVGSASGRIYAVRVPF